MVAQLYIFTKKISELWLNFIVCKLYLNTTAFKRGTIFVPFLTERLIPITQKMDNSQKNKQKTHRKRYTNNLKSRKMHVKIRRFQYFFSHRQ